MTPGNVVVLNGTSSAGKTTTARAVQQVMERPYLHTGVDHFLRSLPERCFTNWIGSDPPQPDYFLLLWTGGDPTFVPRVAAGAEDPGLGDFAGLRIGPAGIHLLESMYRSIRALATDGIDIILDEVFHDERILRAAVNALWDLPVLFVALRIPREIAEQRERERGDRAPGGVAAFYEGAYGHDLYDLELDVSVLTPEECALRIKDALESDLPGQAFRELHERFVAKAR